VKLHPSPNHARGAALAVALAAAGAAGAEPLSRADVVARALQANPGVQKSLEDLAILDARKGEALADALPELKLYGTFTRFRDPSLLNSSSFDDFPPELRQSLRPIPANIYDGRAELRQTLFSFKIGRAVRAARLAGTLGAEDVRRARQEVALEAVRAYNEHLLALEKVRVAEKAVRQKEQHLEMARNRRAAGVATELDVLRSQVDLENARVTLRRLRGAADLARATLNAVMVRPIDTPVEPTDTLGYVPLDLPLEQVVREAWSNRPEARAAELSERIYDEFVGVEQAEGRPRLDFLGDYGWSVRRPRNFFDPEFSKWNLAVTLTVPVFDGRRTASKVAQARAARNKVSQDRIDLENRIRLEARDSLDRLNVAREIFEAAELNVEQAQKALDMTQANYNHGAATTLDVLDAQAALVQAESTRIEALYTHANARATLRYVMARDVLDDAPAGAAQTPEDETGRTTR
jgi:outer membrane protein TolC